MAVSTSNNMLSKLKECVDKIEILMEVFPLSKPQLDGKTMIRDLFDYVELFEALNKPVFEIKGTCVTTFDFHSDCNLSFEHKILKGFLVLDCNTDGKKSGVLRYYEHDDENSVSHVLDKVDKTSVEIVLKSLIEKELREMAAEFNVDIGTKAITPVKPNVKPQKEAKKQDPKSFAAVAKRAQGNLASEFVEERIVVFKGKKKSKNNVCEHCNRAHPGQECWKCENCGGYGHTTERCLSCKNCGGFGHSSDNCWHCDVCHTYGHTADRCYECNKCGEFGHAENRCPYWYCKICEELGLCEHTKCNICGVGDHIARVCPDKKRSSDLE